MAENLGALVAKLTADISGLKAGLAEGRQQLASFQTLAQEAGAKVKAALTFVGVAVGIYEIAGALKEFAVSAAMVGARTETLNIAMEQVGKTYGVSAASLKFYVDELKVAGITTQESMTAVTKAMTTGIPLDQLKDLATRARDIAVVAGINTSEALNRMMHGIISGEQETLRRLMIQVGHSDEIYKRFAATLGTTAEQLNSVQKTQAMLNEVMRLSAGFAGIAAAADASVGKQLESMKRFAEEAKNALWSLFGPVMTAAVQEMTRGWKELKKWADENRESLYDWGQTIGDWIKWTVQAGAGVVQWSIANAQLLKSLLELYVISKLITWIQALSLVIKGSTAVLIIFHGMVGGLVPVLLGAATTVTVFTANTVGMTTALTTATAAGAALNAMMHLLLPSLLAVAGALAAYGAYQTIKKPASLDQMSREESALLGEAAVLALPKETVDEFGGYEKPLPGGVLGYESPAERKARANRESEAAIAKAMQDAPKPAGKAGAKGAGAEGLTDRLLSETLKMLKAKREAEVQEAEGSLELLRATNEAKRAELARSLAAELIDGENYYRSLQDLNQAETDAALALIEKKKQIQVQAHKEALANLADKTLPGFKDLSEEARSLAAQTLEAKHKKEMAKLATEAAKAKLDGEVKVTEELKRQVEVKKQYADTTEAMNIDTAQLLGAITEQEATLMRLNLEWKKNRDAALNAGLSPDDAFFAAGEMNLAAKKGEALYGGYATQITQGISSLADALMSGGRDLQQTANTVFKGLFSESLKPGLEQLKNLLTNGFKELFGAAGSAISSAVMGVIGLVGMMLTSGGGSKSWSASGVQGGVTAHEAVRGVIAGEASIPIAQIGVSLQDALVPTNSILSQIEGHLRGGWGGGGGGDTLNVNVTGPGFREALEEFLSQYFSKTLMQGT